MKRVSRILFAIIVIVVGLGAAGLAVLQSLDFNQYRGLIAERIEGLTGRKLTINGDLNLDISLNSSLRLEDVSLANADWGSRPEMVRISRLEAAVELLPLLSGEARITQIRISGFDLLVETNEQGTGNWLVGAGTAKTTESPKGTETPFVPIFNEVVLEDLRVTYRDGISGEFYEGRVDTLTARQAERGQPIDLVGKGAIGNAPYAFDGTIGPIAALIESKDYPVAFRFFAFGSEIAIDGKLVDRSGAGGGNFSLSAKADDLAQSVETAKAAFAALDDIGVPGVPMSLSANVRQSGDVFELTGVDVKVGGSDLTGQSTVTKAGDRTMVNAQFASQRLDLASLLPSDGKVKAAGQPATGGGGEPGQPARLFSPDPLPLDGLRTVDGKIALTADSLILPAGITVEDVVVHAAIERGRLTASPLQARLGGGKIDGKIDLDGLTDTASLSVSVNGTNVVTGDLLNQFGLSDLVEGGATDLKLELAGKGASVRDIMAGLDGALTIEVGEGRIRNSALDIAGADVFMQLLGALNPVAAQEDFSALSCAVVNFDIADGLAAAKQGIALETDKVNVVGEGAIDLKTEKIDFAFRPEAREGAGINLAGAAAGLIRVRGTLANPGVGVDKAGAAKTAASVGAALATGGLSLLGEALMSRKSRDPNPCLTALGKAPPKNQPTAGPQPTPGEKPSGSPVDKIGEDAKNLLEGVGGAFRGLFGGKK